MPTPFLHLPIADRVATRLSLPPEAWPAFLWGSASPDAAHFLGLPRGTTHFWDLENDVSGTIKLLEAHPHLAAGRLAADERAFVAGYLCHLAADEQWTFVIWRPYFGRHSPYGGGAEAAAIQNALRGVLDEREFQRSLEDASLRRALEDAVRVRLGERLLPFLPTAELRRHHVALVEAMQLAPGTERQRHWEQVRTPARDARGAAGERLAHAQPPSQAAEVPRERALEYVGEASLATFERRAIDASVLVVADYLAGRPIRPPIGTADPATLDRAASGETATSGS